MADESFKERGVGLPKHSLDPAALRTQGQFTMDSSGWFGPQKPLLPVAPPQVAGRQFDLPPGYNINTKPRVYEPISFETLRQLADGYDLMRLIIETRKDQVDRITWNFRPKNKKKVSDAQLKIVEDFFAKPDLEHSFDQWLRMLMEDLLVLDAPTIWKQYTYGGDLVALHPLDGATIKRVIDDWGRTPKPYFENGQLVYPIAYQQVLKGVPAIDYTVRDLIYAPRNVRTHKVFGYSPVEQVITTVNIALRRQVHTMAYYTEGNIPESLIGVPDAWTPDQIKSFQDYWDSYFTGDAAARRKAKFVPGGVAKTFVQIREPELKSVFDEWLAKVVCYAFSVTSQPFVSQVNRATADNQKEQAEEEGLLPILQWIKQLIDPIVQIDLKQPDIEFSWGEDEQIKPTDEATIFNAYTSNAIMTRNEVREKLGLDPSPLPEANELGFATSTGFIYLDETKKPPPPEPLAEFGDVGEKPKKSGDSNKPDDSKPSDSEKKPVTKLDDEEDDLEKQEGHDVSDQPRDDHGRFASSGGPSSREKKKAERAASRGDTDIAERDEHGRFKAGGITYARIKEIGYKVAIDAAMAAALIGATALVSKYIPGSLVSQGLSAAATDMAGKMAADATSNTLSTAFRAMGMDATRSKAAAGIAKTAVDYIVQGKLSNVLQPKATQKLRQKMRDDLKAKEAKAKAKPAKKDYVDDDLSKSDVTFTSDEIALILRTTDALLPKMLDKLETVFISRLEQANLDDVETIADQVSDLFDTLKAGLNPVQKFDDLLDLSKGMKKIGATEYSRLVSKKAEKAVFQTVFKALQKAGKGAATLVAEALSDGSSDVVKASNASSARAASIAARLDLSALSSAWEDIGDGLGLAASDASHRTLIRIGVDSAEELVGRASENATAWARKHAASMMGKKILPDGSIINDANPEYDITESTRRIVKTTIASGLENGKTQEEIVDDLMEKGFGEDRAKDIAENEVAAANMGGTLQSYLDAEDAGVPIMKGWNSVGDEGVDEDICAKNEAQGPIPVSQAFQSGHMAPLGHNRCRCSLLAYVGLTGVQSNVEEDS